MFVCDRNGNLVMAPKFDNHEEASLALLGVREHLDNWEAYRAEKQGRPTHVVSEFLRLSSFACLHISRCGTIHTNGIQLFIHDRSGELVMAPKFANPEEAEQEQDSLNEQLDRWEAHQANDARRPSRR